MGASQQKKAQVWRRRWRLCSTGSTERTTTWTSTRRATGAWSTWATTTRPTRGSSRTTTRTTRTTARTTHHRCCARTSCESWLGSDGCGNPTRWCDAKSVTDAIYWHDVATIHVCILPIWTTSWTSFATKHAAISDSIWFSPLEKARSASSFFKGWCGCSSSSRNCSASAWNAWSNAIDAWTIWSRRTAFSSWLHRPESFAISSWHGYSKSIARTDGLRPDSWLSSAAYTSSAARFVGWLRRLRAGESSARLGRRQFFESSGSCCCS
mmetsp:Transcript_27163/g.42199  ORF Transcript_27163/g.42199 Transcript_27163/m.42199 type:complete len:267 (-) Transcript_27163:86-886(-)